MCHAHISSAVSCRNGLQDVHDEESPISMITLNRLELLQQLHSVIISSVLIVGHAWDNYDYLSWRRDVEACFAVMPRWWVCWHSDISSDSYAMMGNYRIVRTNKADLCELQIWTHEYVIFSRRISYLFLQSTHLFWPCSYLFETLSYLFKPLSYYIFTVYIFVCVYFSQTNKLCDGQLASSYNEYDIFMDKLASTCS